MHLEDDQWNDVGAETPSASAAPWSGPTLDVAEEPSEQLTQDLMSFLDDFRSAVNRDVAASEAKGEEKVPGATVKTSPVPTGVARGAFAEDEPSWEDDPYLGSPVQVAADWWMAADGRWYPPELHPDRSVQPAPGPDDPAHVADGEDRADVPTDQIPAAASRPERPGRKTRLSLVRPRLGKLGQSPATA